MEDRLEISDSMCRACGSNSRLSPRARPCCPLALRSFRREGLSASGLHTSVPVPGRPFLRLVWLLLQFGLSRGVRVLPWNWLRCCLVCPPCPVPWQHLPRLSWPLSASESRRRPFGGELRGLVFRSCFCFPVMFPSCRRLTYAETSWLLTRF